jgi:hypothetical protein
MQDALLTAMSPVIARVGSRQPGRDSNKLDANSTAQCRSVLQRDMATAAIIPEGEPFVFVSLNLKQEAIPHELQDSVQRHQRHLAALVESLRAAGVGEDVIEASVSQLLESYRNELTDAMRALLMAGSNV